MHKHIGLAVLAAAFLFSTLSAQETSIANLVQSEPPIDRAGDVTQAEPSPSPMPSYARPTPKIRFKRFVNDTVGPLALAREVAGAGWSTWQNTPEEWGAHGEGFGRRFASNFGTNVIKQTVTYGLDEALKLDSHYYLSMKKDLGSKIKNALLSPISARDRTGRRVIGIPRIVGTYGSNIIATETWYPNRYGWKDGLKNGTISIGLNAAYNLFREFILKK